MTFSERLKIFFRLHFLQCLWNYKGMQHFGCLSALRPVLSRLYGGQDYLEAEKRQAQYFNTHPYFAPICMGVVAKLEEELKAGSFAKPEMIPVLKNRMSGPLAAVGDAYFWETLRPITGSLAVLCILAFGPGSDAALVSLVVLVLAYILPVEWIRWQGFSWGYRHGLNVVDVLKKKDFHGSMRRVRNMGALLLGMTVIVFLLDGGSLCPACAGDVTTTPGTAAAAWAPFFIRAAVLGLVLLATLAKWSPTVLLYLTALAGFAAGVIL